MTRSVSCYQSVYLAVCLSSCLYFHLLCVKGRYTRLSLTSFRLSKQQQGLQIKNTLKKEHTIAGIGETRDTIDDLFCSLAFLDLRVGHTMDVLSPFISILCHSD